MNNYAINKDSLFHAFPFLLTFIPFFITAVISIQPKLLPQNAASIASQMCNFHVLYDTEWHSLNFFIWHISINLTIFRLLALEIYKFTKSFLGG